MSATAQGGGVGPKQTINNAIAAASNGDVIVVSYANGNLYNENVNLVDKKLTFNSTGGTPSVVSFVVNNTLAAPNNTTTFGGPFKFNNGLALTAGKVVGGNNLTVGSTVVRTAGEVDSQLNYSGVVDFTYNGGVAITTGFELPASGNITNFGDLTTVGAGTALKLNESKTMNGNLVTAAGLDLNTFTLTLVGALTHTVGADVTNGTLGFTGGATVNGNFDLPNITATASGAATLALNTNQDILNVTASGAASVSAPNAVTVKDVTNNGSGAVTFPVVTTAGNLSNNAGGNIVVSGAGATAATTVGSVTNTAGGFVNVNPVGFNLTTGSITQSGKGQINLAITAGGTTVTVNGNILVNPDLALTNATVANAGLVTFGDRIVVVNGNVTVSTKISGTATRNNSGAETVYSNAGSVLFASTNRNVTVTGSINVSTSNTGIAAADAGLVAGAASVTNSGTVLFASTTGNLSVGTVSITTSFASVTNVTLTENGSVLALNRAGGTFAAGDISNSSSASNGVNGNFKTVSTVNAGFSGGNLTTSGAAGGYVVFANETVTLSGKVVNSRTSAADHIQFGTVATAGLSYSFTGNVENTGSSNIYFAGFNGAGAENLSFNGKLIVSGGKVYVNPAAAMNGTGTIQLVAGVELTGGEIDLTGAATTNMDVLVGNSMFKAGKFDVAGPALASTLSPLAIAAADRVLQLTGLSYQFSDLATRTDFSTNANTVLLVRPTTIITAQVVSGNATQTVWPGILVVDNTTNLTPAVTFNGGNFRILKGVAINTNSNTLVDNITIFIGGQLAPNAGTGDFYNYGGFATNGQGFISLNSLTACTFGGAGKFQNFEVDVPTGINVTAAAGLGDFTKTFNLTSGNVLTANNVVFNNTVDYPTIVRNAGTFAVAPTFTSMVNVLYIGLDKATSLELPVATNKLYNLTVATTNDGTAPLVATKGAVTASVATTVNGTLNVYPGQALVLNAILTMKGDKIILDGDITNTAAVNYLSLAATAGVTITGSGWLPDINVASLGNVINGAKGLVTNFLGTDNSRGDIGLAADFDATVSQASGSITFANAAAALTTTFGAGALNGTHLFNITTVNAANVLNLASNTTQAGNFALGNGVVNIAEGKTLSYRGLAPVIDGKAKVQGPGLLAFRVGPTLLSTPTSAVTISAPVEINLANAGDDFQINPAAGNFNVTFAGDFTFTKGEFFLGDNVTGRNLTLTGKNFTMTGTSSFAAVTPAFAFVLGTLVLNPATANVPMNWSYTGAPTLGNVTVSNDVTLGGTGTGLVVYRNFLHNGGKLDFSSREIEINAVQDLDPGVPVVLAAGTFTRTVLAAPAPAPTYDATSGYLVIRTAAFTQGTDFSIPNLRFGKNADAVSPTFASASNATVTKKLYIDVAAAQTIAHTVTTARLNVADMVDVYWVNGKFDVAPVYAATINLHLMNALALAVPATVWPATATLVSTLEVDNTASANLADSRQINKELLLTTGNLDVATTKKLTLVDNVAINVVDGTLNTIGTGSVVFGVGHDVTYAPTAAYWTSAELPLTAKTLTFTRSANVFNFPVSLLSSVTVEGLLDIKNDINVGGGLTFKALGNVNIANESADFSRATDPVTNFFSPLTFAGSDNQTVTVPEAGASLGDLEFNKATNGNTVTLVGGNLTSGFITFVNGVFKTGDHIVYIPAGLQGAAPATLQGFSRAGVTGTNISHVDGFVGKQFVNSGVLATSTFPRQEFPVGSATKYRPAAVSFNNQFGTPGTPSATIVVKHEDMSPTGFTALPIANGVEEDVAVGRYAPFYWNIKTTPSSVGPSIFFDLELTATGYTSYGDPNLVRIIRRHGQPNDITNQWLLQGLPDNYDNEINGGVLTTINRASNAGLRAGGAIFTLGMKSNIKVDKQLPKLWLVQNTAPVEVSLEGVFSNYQGTALYIAQSSNETVAKVSVSSGKVKVTPVGIGDAFVTVTVKDGAGDFMSTTFDVNVGLTSVEEEVIPTEFALMQNYPNPFNPTTNIKFALPKESNVTMRVYNVLGEEVSTLINKVMPAGFHTVNFDASRLSNGMYIYRIEADNFVSVKKMLLVK
ncbi:hypothetical protein APF79_00045 [bacterium BRH_c32]|nr:MAG: hypothetical protein APF79_00045 [bacterium BRH_c32]